MNLVPDLALIGAGIGAEHEGPGDVRLITVDRAGAVHQHHLAAPDELRLMTAVRIGRGLAEQDEPAVIGRAQLLVGGGDHRVDVRRRHALSRPRPGIAQGGDHDVGGRLHERELGGRLDHPQLADDGIGADDASARELLLQPVLEEEAVGLLEPHRRAGGSALAEEIGDELQRLLVLLPGADLRRDRQHLLDAGLLEEGRDDDRFALGGNDDAGQPLAAPPLDAGEIIEARPRFDEHRADAVLLHQGAGAGETLKTLGDGDRRRNRDFRQLCGRLRHDLARQKRQRGGQRAPANQK